MEEINYIALIHDINEALSSPEEIKKLLKHNDGIFNKNDKEKLIFDAVYQEFVSYGGCQELLEYLIFEYNIKNDNSIDILGKNINKKVKKMFESRELNKDLNKNLESHIMNKKTIKV